MRRAVLAVLLLSLGLAPAAAAQTGTIGGAGPGHVVGGVALVDDELVWAQRDDAFGVRLVSGGFDRPARVLATVPAPRGASGVHVAFGANRTHALLYAVFEGPGYKGVPEILGRTLVFGPRGALREIGEPAGFGYAAPRLVGERVAYELPSPGLGMPMRIRFADPATGALSDVAIPLVNSWDAAGDLVAHQRPTAEREPVVTNWRTGEELYDAERPAGFTTIGGVRLAPDGTAAWAGTLADGPDAGTPRIGISTPHEPRMRLLPTQDKGLVAMGAGRLLYARYAEPQWEVGDLDGREVARWPRDPATAAAAFDGRRIVSMSRPCALPMVNVYAFENPPEPKGVAPARCVGARVAGRPSVARGTLRVPLRCEGTEGAGCVTDVSAVVRRRGRQPYRLELLETALAAGERRAVDLMRPRNPFPRGRLRITIATVARKDGDARQVRRFRLRR